ncbi:hypothetical protein ASPWEDRAFT_41406 [Aspergillus wentii DTO 134E9]|uniref:DUF2241 domain-containing protein n=1 Tax=Aspergillus wentii DTO 134E9 TaxID=1073089 RepID=A0A1L9RMN3_ASPWE|nr:uncharacterized protein ASPWEDRAFT_41406 [Aspergillus wentii DTO 134E9]KAI9929370.1 hypothetical protein MW887_000839 [Aspergillus wentii]OJJ36191.1 hypothetical protein ASPWEDRAFT_41406 [Aspergillus wentii DTO 134E9]
MPPTPGEADITTLLASLEPTLDPQLFVFITTKIPLESLPFNSLKPEMLFHEKEGLTIITTAGRAQAHGYHDAVFPCRKISLTVHSSLEAVGLIAAISKRYTERGISSNVVSGFYHDHIFVPDGLELEAMEVLRDMAAEAGEQKRSRQP